MVVAERQPSRDALAVAVEVLADTLAEQIEGLQAVRLRAAWTPTHSAVQWSTVRKTVAGPLGGPGGGGADAIASALARA